MTTRERLHRLVDELSEQEADDALAILDRAHSHERNGRPTHRPHEIEQADQALIASYTQVPQEDLGASWAARQSIRDEPWDRRRMR